MTPDHKFFIALGTLLFVALTPIALVSLAPWVILIWEILR